MIRIIYKNILLYKSEKKSNDNLYKLMNTIEVNLANNSELNVHYENSRGCFA